jgi:transcription factor IIIB subunit 2
MRLGPTIKDRAVRFFNLAVSNGFVQGRRTDYVVAACLYIACRLDANSMCMLIDFSDLLKVNVFVLGATFLKLVRSLNMSDKLKPTDPAHLIQRFAALLDFGDETQKVATDAARLVDRFKRDWMVEGRRPAGICGACLLLAARMNNFRRSIDEIVQVVKIADVTVRKRLEEFSKTPNGALTVEDFQNGTTYTEPADPPAFTASQDKERERTGAKESAGTPGSSKGMLVFESPVSASSGKKRKAPPSPAGVAPPEDDDVDPAMTQAIGDEVKEALNTSEAQAVTTELEAHEAAELARQRAQAEEPPDALDDLDEEELDSFILTDAERAVKERLWVLNNKDYLETLAEKHLRGEADEPKKRRKRVR